MEDYNIQSYHLVLVKITNVGYVKNIYNLLRLAECQCKGMVKFNLSDLFFWGQFRKSWKPLNWKNLLLTLNAVTRIINLV